MEGQFLAPVKLHLLQAFSSYTDVTHCSCIFQSLTSHPVCAIVQGVAEQGRTSVEGRPHAINGGSRKHIPPKNKLLKDREK